MSEVELDHPVLIVIFLKITEAPLRFMIVSFNRCEGTGKGAVLCQDCSNATVRFRLPAGRFSVPEAGPNPVGLPKFSR
jgi:hypothetical protein